MVSLPAWAFRVPIGRHFGGFFGAAAAAVGGRLGGGGGPVGPVAQGVGERAIRSPRAAGWAEWGDWRRPGMGAKRVFGRERSLPAKNARD